MNLPNLTGSTARLADYLHKTFAMQGWTIDLFINLKVDIAMEKMNAAEAVDYYKDTLIQANILKTLFIKEDAIDWKALFEYSDGFIRIKPETIDLEIRKNEQNLKQLLEGYTPKPLREALSLGEFEKCFKELREHEYGRAFRAYKIDRILAFIDWLDRNRGPLSKDKSVLSKEIKSFTNVISGAYLAKIWIQTLHLRYPGGAPWKTAQ